MRDLNEILTKYDEDITGIDEWCENLYKSKFSTYFEDIQNLYTKMNKQGDKFTDADLEKVLTDVPLSLFSLSEALNSLRTAREIAKLRVRQDKSELKRELLAEFQANKDTCGYTKSDIPGMVSDKFLEDDIVDVAFTGVITRVENEISFTKEFIMGVKKIWDRRKSTEDVNPIGAVVPEYETLPDYVPKNVDF